VYVVFHLCCTLALDIGCHCVDGQVVEWHFWLKKNEILSQVEDWIGDLETYSTDKRVGRSIAHSCTSLKVSHIAVRLTISLLKFMHFCFPLIKGFVLYNVSFVCSIPHRIYSLFVCLFVCLFEFMTNEHVDKTVHQRCFGRDTLNELSENVDFQNIIAFIKDVNFCRSKDQQYKTGTVVPSLNRCTEVMMVSRPRRCYVVLF